MELADIVMSDTRKTAATVVAEAAGGEAAQHLLGHASLEVTQRHYIRRRPRVEGVTADALDAALGQVSR
jgi:integrase